MLARTGTREERHRGLTAFIVDLRSPGVEVSPIEQANGTDELAEVVFDDVHVPADRIVGELGGGWAVAMHILSHERGTFAWFRHCFMYQQLLETAAHDSGRNDRHLGEALLDLAAVTATGHAGVVTHAADETLGPKAAYTKLLLCAAEQAVQDCALAADPDLAVGLQTPGGRARTPGVPVLPDRHRVRRLAADAARHDRQADPAAAVTYDPDRDDAFLTTSARPCGASSGPAALDALGWWDLLPHLDDDDARTAVFAAFRAQGRELGGSAALGGIVAQPFIEGTAIAPGTVVAAIAPSDRTAGAGVGPRR